MKVESYRGTPREGRVSPSQALSWINEEETEKIEQDGETERERELWCVVTPALLKLLNENTEKGVRATEIDEVGELY